CAEAEDLLRARGLWDRIDRVVIAEEGNASSEGMQLGQKFGVPTAPFFVVKGIGGQESEEQVVTSTLKLMRLLADGFLTPSIPAPASIVPPTTAEEVALFSDQLAHAEPQESLRFLLGRFGSDCAIAFSGAEDVVLIDMASRLGLRYSVFCLDTGRLHPETYRFIDKVRTHYGIEVELYSPQA